ncbi:hypothetical protein BDF20DRAFT_876877 [Mycotypha africana]|uniref:uncharacterized protein n=1 Tax=Mycotypha africana TaxID=64632 RepID=UPI0023016C59|nr:uncharacterized protein BDF20DRAFT_876877 [Mycotypha africana]KAI8975100.1 hypothetical protein BDF20DRAFT_876877 [Mycotypha africana]
MVYVSLVVFITLQFFCHKARTTSPPSIEHCLKLWLTILFTFLLPLSIRFPLRSVYHAIACFTVSFIRKVATVVTVYLLFYLIIYPIFNK